MGNFFTFVTDNGVFSKTEVDCGTQVLLKAIHDIGLYGDVLDLGCGYGVIGIVLKKLIPELNIVSVDVNPRALELTKLNGEKNQTDLEVIESNGFNHVHKRFDFVITNPPIRTGKKVIYAMFEDAYEHLNENGKLIAVIRKQQGAQSAVKKFEEVFGNCEVIEKDKGYWILVSQKLTI